MTAFGERPHPDRGVLPLVRPATPFCALVESAPADLGPPPAGREMRPRAAGPEERKEEGEAEGRHLPGSPTAPDARTITIREAFPAAVPAAPPAAPGAAEIQLLAETMLRSLRIGGDGRGGHEARLDIGRGPFAGASVRLVERAGRLRAEVTGGDHGVAAILAARLARALADRGIPVDEVRG